MVFISEAMTWEEKPSGLLRDFLILLQPFAPHVTEELCAKLHATRNTSPPSLTPPGRNSTRRCWSRIPWKSQCR
ncbi:MAG: hypothetical protein NT154_16510 [Verrucomicrobia bacterium]|nr:hypothetical protein [Verrucomicrobiota bacterium]